MLRLCHQWGTICEGCFFDGLTGAVHTCRGAHRAIRWDADVQLLWLEILA